MRLVLALLLLLPCVVFAHPGGSNKYGCHNQTGGEYHCANSEVDLVAAELMFDLLDMILVESLPAGDLMQAISNDSSCYVFVPDSGGEYTIGNCILSNSAMDDATENIDAGGMSFTNEEIQVMRYCMIIACAIMLDDDIYVRRPNLNVQAALEFWEKNPLPETPEVVTAPVEEPPVEEPPADSPTGLEGFVLSSSDINCRDGMSWHYQCGGQSWTDQPQLFVAVCVNYPGTGTCTGAGEQRQWRDRNLLQTGEWVLTCPTFIASGNRNSCLADQYYQQV